MAGKSSSYKKQEELQAEINENYGKLGKLPAGWQKENTRGEIETLSGMIGNEQRSRNPINYKKNLLSKKRIAPR